MSERGEGWNCGQEILQPVSVGDKEAKVDDSGYSLSAGEECPARLPSEAEDVNVFLIVCIPSILQGRSAQRGFPGRSALRGSPKCSIDKQGDVGHLLG